MHPLKHSFSVSTAILSGCSQKVISWVHKYFSSSTLLIPTVISQLRCSRLHSIAAPGSHYTSQSSLPTTPTPFLSSIETSRQHLSTLTISSSKSTQFQKHHLPSLWKKQSFKRAGPEDLLEQRKQYTCPDIYSPYSNYSEKWSVLWPVIQQIITSHISLKSLHDMTTPTHVWYLLENTIMSDVRYTRGVSSSWSYPKWLRC